MIISLYRLGLAVRCLLKISSGISDYLRVMGAVLGESDGITIKISTNQHNYQDNYQLIKENFIKINLLLNCTHTGCGLGTNFSSRFCKVI